MNPHAIRTPLYPAAIAPQQHRSRLLRLSRPLLSMLAPGNVVAMLGCGDDTESPVAPEPAPALATAPLPALSFRQVSAGLHFSCGATTDDRAYCWGNNVLGQLGDGTSTARAKPVPVAGGLCFRQALPGAGHVLGAGEQVPDFAHTCGVATDDRAYCWGGGHHGQLGDGSSAPYRRTPVAVAGGRRFRYVSPGAFHTCGVTVFDGAFCWGSNSSGQLGTGGGSSTTPVRVAGGLAFRNVSTSVGSTHTCGVTTNYRAYCWGSNSAGQLGDGTTT